MTTQQRRPAALETTTTGTAPAVRCRGVVRRFSGGTLALDGLDLDIAAGEIVAIVGVSGSGKSTLLELVCGLQQPDAGTVDAVAAALMPQRDALLPWFDATDNAALPLRIAGQSRAAARAAAGPLLEEIGLGAFRRARVWELSGGMRQRVAVARTLLSGADVLCLDEPFGALDALTRSEIQRWFAGLLADRPRAVVLVTHDVEEAALLADRVLVMSPRPGRIVAELPVAAPRPAGGRDPGDPIVQDARAAALAVLTDAGAGC